MELWEPALPPAAIQHIMLHLVLPRLREAVGGWDPLRDTVALHTWVHPWLVSAFRTCTRYSSTWLRYLENSFSHLHCFVLAEGA